MNYFVSNWLLAVMKVIYLTESQFPHILLKGNEVKLFLKIL